MHICHFDTQHVKSLQYLSIKITTVSDSDDFTWACVYTILGHTCMKTVMGCLF
jgi:hypothetical protein